MPTDHRAKLVTIKRLDQLIAYLRDEMDWPIARDSFEDVDDLFYDFSADELGIDPKTAAKIEEIKRLRPLSSKQPWGIFFVKFSPTRLPVVALRRILSHVALKKRPSANSDERAAWAADDLLFISNYGEGEKRRISFAHFSRAKDGRDLPTLKVLGWDNLDTALHLDAVSRELTEHLAWPDDGVDVEAWRSQWRGAFTLRHREVITTSRELSIRLAELARAIRDRISTALSIETEKGPLTRLMKAFREALIHDLDADGFADMYAQTIAYGLLSARIADPQKKTTDDFAAHMRTNPFLRELMETFLKIGGRQGKAGGPGIDFDELGVSDVVDLLDDANMEAVIRDFGDRNPQEDPVIHFYELFLKEYDAKKRMQRGVFYTPRPVVSYIVRSVDELLRTEFGLADGLADTTTWGEMADRNTRLKIPAGVSPDQDFVQILDPATGTGTFLVEVIDLIHKTLVAKWEEQGHGEKVAQDLWNEYVPKHLLTRLHGYELMMAPYTIAHLKIGLKLYESGYRFDSEERARVYLTNTLEPAQQNASGTFEFALPALAREATAVSTVKDDSRFTVIVGNPPYSIQSGNLEENARRLVDAYRFVDGAKIHERNALQFEKNLQDDYVKFIRFAELCVSASGHGIVGYISNDSFLDGRSFRGMRQHLMKTFPQLDVLDLHGSLKKRSSDPSSVRDENVFEIQQGVCISLMRTQTELAGDRAARSAECFGSRSTKYYYLSNNSHATTTWAKLDPSSPFYLLSTFDSALSGEYLSWPSLRDAATRFSSGIKTHKDRFAYAFSEAEMQDRLREFRDPSVADGHLRREYALKDTALWQLAEAREMLRRAADTPVRPALCRPFDVRFIAYSEDIVRYTARPTMQHLDGEENLALLVCQQQVLEGFSHAFVTRIPADCCAVSNRSRESTSAFPLYLRRADPNRGHHDLFDRAGFDSNLTPDFVRTIDRFAESVLEPRTVFGYVYAVLHAPSYRSRYASLLKSDFPRLPIPGGMEVYRALAKRGNDLIALHLLEAPDLEHPITEYVGPSDPVVEKVSFVDQAVWIDDAQTIGFKGVPDEVWRFEIGSYRVCEKWLKDRQASRGKSPTPGRVLSAHDVTHYQKIVVAIAETIRLMQEIDVVIEEHGGWPDAFLTSAARAAGNQSPAEDVEPITDDLTGDTNGEVAR